jgi:hypothetical protein
VCIPSGHEENSSELHDERQMACECMVESVGKWMLLADIDLNFQHEPLLYFRWSTAPYPQSIRVPG